MNVTQHTDYAGESVLQLHANHTGGNPQELPQRYEFIDSKELAARWNLPESWIRDQVRRRSSDPIPYVRFGKYVRFRWGSPELEAWAERRIVSSSNRVEGRALRKESK